MLILEDERGYTGVDHALTLVLAAVLAITILCSLIIGAGGVFYKFFGG